MTAPAYWKLAEKMAKERGVAHAIKITTRMLKVANKAERDYWFYVLTCLQRMQDKAKAD